MRKGEERIGLSDQQQRRRNGKQHHGVCGRKGGKHMQVEHTTKEEKTQKNRRESGVNPITGKKGVR